MSDARMIAGDTPLPLPLHEAIKGRFIGALDSSMRQAIVHAGAISPAERAEALRLVRRGTKIGRALLPFLVNAAPPESLAGASRALRDAAGLLSAIRDRDAMLATIDRLFGSRSGARTQHARAMLAIVVVPAGVECKARELEDLLVMRASAMLARLAASAQRFQFERVTVRDIAKPIASELKRLRREQRSGWFEGPIERAHSIRKGCSRMVLQLTAIEEHLPRSARRLRKALREVNSRLGDEHDLAMLAERISLDRSRFPSEEFVNTALDLCRRAQRRLRERATGALEEAAVIRPRDLRRKLHEALADLA